MSIHSSFLILAHHIGVRVLSILQLAWLQRTDVVHGAVHAFFPCFAVAAVTEPAARGGAHHVPV